MTGSLLVLCVSITYNNVMKIYAVAELRASSLPRTTEANAELC